MRNLKTFLIATTAIVALSSCSKDNNTPQPAPACSITQRVTVRG
ncbi:MAG: hypothetical protein ACFN23_03485 [Capnocytophaga gingivalis]